MMKKEMKVERNRWKSTEGAYEVNRGDYGGREGTIDEEKGKRMKGRHGKDRCLEKQIRTELGLDPGK